jgi:transposase
MPKQHPRELRERAVCLVAEHRGEYETECAAIWSIAAKLRIATAEALRRWSASLRATPGSGPGEQRRVRGDLAAEVKELRRRTRFSRRGQLYFRGRAVCPTRRL